MVERVTPEQVDRATIAEFEIFSGKFDYMFELNRAYIAYGCTFDSTCDFKRDCGVDGVHADFHRHLLSEHLDQVIEAIGQRP